MSFMTFDLSHILNNDTPVYPGDRAIYIKNQASLEQDCYVSYTIHSGLHVGTHIDAPMHMIADTPTIDTYSLEHFFGNAVIINVSGQDNIGLTEAIKSSIQAYDIVLFYTGFDQYFKNLEIYFNNHPVITMELAEHLVATKVKLIGFDMPSPDRMPFTVHEFLLQNNVFIVENLTNLQSLLTIKHFEFFAVPLKIEAEGSFVRAFAKV